MTAATATQAVAPTSGTTAAIDGRAGCDFATAASDCTIVTAATVDVEARSKLVEDVITGGAGIGATAAGVGVVVTTIDNDVSAYDGPGTSLQGVGGAGTLSVIAHLDETIKVIGAAGASAGSSRAGRPSRSSSSGRTSGRSSGRASMTPAPSSTRRSRTEPSRSAGPGSPR